MFRKIGILSCLAALFVLGGGHWAALQTVAWARMIADYSKDKGVSGAIAMTFDGKNPCDMCKGISKGKSEEKKSETVKSEKKVEPFVSQESPLLVLSFSCDPWFALQPLFQAQAGPGPQSPPPRLFFS